MKNKHRQFSLLVLILRSSRYPFPHTRPTSETRGAANKSPCQRIATAYRLKTHLVTLTPH
jgi:hypothetical protein